MRNFIVAVVMVLVLAIAGYFIYTNLIVKPLIAKGEFGYETVKSMTKGNLRLTCDDAKILVVMIDEFNTLSNNLPEDPNSLDNATKDNMTAARDKIDSSIANFGKAIETKFSNDNVTREEALNTLGSDIGGIFEFMSFKNKGMVSDEHFNEAIEVVFCGAKPTTDFPFMDNKTEGVEKEGIESAPENGMGGKTMTEPEKTSPANDNNTQPSANKDNKTK